MKNTLFTLALLVSFSSTLAQNIDNLKKRELKELANTQKKQLIIKNNQIVDQNTIIENSLEKINVLNQIKIRLLNFKLSSLDSINKLNTKNAIIPSLENEIIKLTDSINSINNLLSSYILQVSSSINQDSTSTSYGFLNNLYLGYSQIENQTFRLVPAGVIARNNHIRNNNNNGGSITQFISMAELNIGIQENKKTYLSNINDVKDFKQLIKDNYKLISGDKLYKLYPEIFPTFSFIKGKLLTITNEKDFLFSVKDKNLEDLLAKQLGQKGTYFSLTDDNEKEYLLQLILINDEVYLRINKSGNRNTNNSLAKIGMKWSVTSNLKSRVVRYFDNGERSEEADIDSYENRIMTQYYDKKNNSYKYKYYDNSDYYLECAQTYISTFLIPSIYESGVMIDPEMFLFKLEEI